MNEYLNDIGNQDRCLAAMILFMTMVFALKWFPPKKK